jgi:hypothetical protein
MSDRRRGCAVSARRREVGVAPGRLVPSTEQVSARATTLPAYAWRSHASAAAPFKDRQRPPAVAGARIPGATYCARPGGRRSAPRVAARRIDAARDGLTLDELLWLISRARFREPGRQNDAQEVPLGNECLPNRCGCPSVRAVNRWNVLRIQLLGDLLQRHSLPEQCVDLLPPYVVTVVAELVREPDVVGG